MDKLSLKKIQELHYEDISHDTLVDVNEIDIDTKKEITERLVKFINDVKNPYVIKCGNTIVEVAFSDTEKTIECQIKSYLESLNTNDLSC